MPSAHVPTANINALYQNTTAGVTANPEVVDAAVADIVSTINQNADYVNSLVTSGTLSPIPPDFLYRQAIINGRFDVWQRGTSFDNVSAGTYTADRWKVSFNNVLNNVKVLRSTTVPNANSRYSLRVEQMGSMGASGDYSDISQPIEDAALFSGQKVVFSGWVKCDAGRSVTPLISAGGNVYAGTPISATSFTQFSFVQQLPAGISSLSFILRVNRGGAAVGEGVNIAQVQVNVGDVALPFQPRHIAEEWELCRRYTKVIGRSSPFQVFGHGYANTATEAYIFIPLSPRGRVVPTLTSSGSFRLGMPGGPINVTSMSVSTALSSPDLVVLQVSVASGLTSGQSVALQANNDDNAILIFDMEL